MLGVERHVEREKVVFRCPAPEFTVLLQFYARGQVARAESQGQTAACVPGGMDGRAQPGGVADMCALCFTATSSP
jgi:hypothetical protein